MMKQDNPKIGFKWKLIYSGSSWVLMNPAS